jgi:DNA-binding transcriptional MocR family regulator
VIEQANTRAGTAADPGRDGRARDLAASLGDWAAAGHGTLPRRLAHALRRAIQAGVLPVGWQLPPERRLATDLAVSRTTITDALDELRREGLLTSRQGRGTFVAGAAPATTAMGTRVADHLSGGRGIDLASSNPADLSHLPPVEVDMSLLTAHGGGAQAFPLGLPLMREAVAGLYRHGGVTGAPRLTEPEQIQITTGVHQAVSLLASSLVGRGRAMALAQYGLPGIFDVLDGCAVQPIPVRTDRAGIVPEDLERALVESRPAAMYIQLGADTPTGRATPSSRLRAIAAIADRHDVAVIEDSTQVPLTVPSTSSPARQSGAVLDFCRTATVVSVMSMSKLFWAGFRIGWIRASEPVIERTKHHGLAHDLGPSVPSQLMVLGLLPHVDEIAVERCRRLELAIDAGLDQLRVAIPEAVVERPEGGGVLWVELPIDDTGPFVAAAQRHGVRITPGSTSALGRLPGPFVRISVDRPVELVHEGMARLGRAWREYRGQPGPGPSGNASS